MYDKFLHYNDKLQNTNCQILAQTQVCITQSKIDYLLTLNWQIIVLSIWVLTYWVHPNLSV